MNCTIDGEAAVGWDGGSTVESGSDATTITVVDPDDGNDGNDSASGGNDGGSDATVTARFGSPEVSA